MPELHDEPPTERVGYKKPPRSGRFQKGKSGNPRGRPRNRRHEIPFDHVLGQMVTIRDGGSEKRVAAAEAFLLHLTKRGLEGDGASARESLAAIYAARSKKELDGPAVRGIIYRIVSPGSVGCSLTALGMAVKLRKYTDNAENKLKAWIVEEALARLKDRRITSGEQQEIWNATHKPESINWPSWWTFRG